VLYVVKILNFFFPVKGGVSETLSLKTIMTGETLDYKKHLGLQIGQYCHMHEEENPTLVRLLAPKKRFLSGQAEIFKAVTNSWL
jgi:hypothetical protein